MIFCAELKHRTHIKHNPLLLPRHLNAHAHTVKCNWHDSAENLIANYGVPPFLLASDWTLQVLTQTVTSTEWTVVPPTVVVAIKGF
jgi:hypothetical protein